MVSGNPLLKWALIIVGIVLLIVLFGGSDDSQQTTVERLPRPEDLASGDTKDETLRHLSAQIRQSQLFNESLSKSNQQLQQAINELQQNPPVIVNQNNEDLEAILYERLQQQVDDYLSEQDKRNNTLIYPPAIDESLDDYPVRNQGNQVNSDARITIVRDISLVDGQNDWMVEPTPIMVPVKKEELPKPIPVYTIPENSVLFDTQLMSTIIGRVPVGGSIRNPFTFDVIVGRENLAANNIDIPNIANMRMSGYAIGNATLKCVEGWITSATFVFDDGTIHTVSNRSNSTNVSNMNTQALGQIKDQFGNPCIVGTFVTDAPKVLGGALLLGGAAGAAQAYGNMQTTTSRNSDGDRDTFVTGDQMRFLGGQSGARAAEEALDWWKDRMKDSYDVVYVEPVDSTTGKYRKLSISITQQIPIDYNPLGRKVSYVNPKSLYITHELD